MTSFLSTVLVFVSLTPTVAPMPTTTASGRDTQAGGYILTLHTQNIAKRMKEYGFQDLKALAQQAGISLPTIYSATKPGAPVTPKVVSKIATQLALAPTDTAVWRRA